MRDFFKAVSIWWVHNMRERYVVIRPTRNWFYALVCLISVAWILGVYAGYYGIF